MANRYELLCQIIGGKHPRIGDDRGHAIVGGVDNQLADEAADLTVLVQDGATVDHLLLPDPRQGLVQFSARVKSLKKIVYVY